jgi:hypothetical protein
VTLTINPEQENVWEAFGIDEVRARAIYDAVVDAYRETCKFDTGASAALDMGLDDNEMGLAMYYLGCAVGYRVAERYLNAANERAWGVLQKLTGYRPSRRKEN